jgi:hypothetical protein
MAAVFDLSGTQTMEKLASVEVEVKDTRSYMVMLY